jgi:hypothetical protein
MTHWLDDNPWAEKAVYVPAEELAAALQKGAEARQTIRPGYQVHSAESHLAKWSSFSNAIDAYILPSDRGEHQAGIRFGSKPDQYLSLFVPDEGVLEDLLNRYSAEQGFAP